MICANETERKNKNACVQCKYAATCLVSGFYETMGQVLSGVPYPEAEPGFTKTRLRAFERFIVSLPGGCPYRWMYTV